MSATMSTDFLCSSHWFWQILSQVAFVSHLSSSFRRLTSLTSTCSCGTTRGNLGEWAIALAQFDRGESFPSPKIVGLKLHCWTWLPSKHWVEKFLPTFQNVVDDGGLFHYLASLWLSVSFSKTNRLNYWLQKHLRVPKIMTNIVTHIPTHIFFSPMAIKPILAILIHQKESSQNDKSGSPKWISRIPWIGFLFGMTLLFHKKLWISKISRFALEKAFWEINVLANFFFVGLEKTFAQRNEHCFCLNQS